MHYCLRYDSRAFWPSWVSGSLKGVMPVPLHVLVVLLCSAYMSSCSLHFLSFSVRFIAHSVCDTVWYYFIIFQLHCLGSFLAVVGLVGVFCPSFCRFTWWADLSQSDNSWGFAPNTSSLHSTFSSLSACLFLTLSSPALSSSATYFSYGYGGFFSTCHISLQQSCDPHCGEFSASHQFSGSQKYGQYV